MNRISSAHDVLQWLHSSWTQKPDLELKFPGLLRVMTTFVSSSSQPSQDADSLQYKQAQLSVAAQLCCSVCPCLDMDWKLLGRLIPQLTQVQSGLATVVTGSVSFTGSSGASRARALGESGSEAAGWVTQVKDHRASCAAS